MVGDVQREVQAPLVVVLDVLCQAPVVAYLVLKGPVEPLQLAVGLGVVRPGVYQPNVQAQKLGLKGGRLPRPGGRLPPPAAAPAPPQSTSRCQTGWWQGRQTCPPRPAGRPPRSRTWPR